MSTELAALVAGRFGSRSPGTPRARSSNRPYALRGIIYCSRCGSRLQGSYRPSRGDRPGRVLYRCEIRRTRALPAELADHPSTLYVNEAAILEPLDAWIESFSDPAWLAESQTADPASAARLSGM